MAVSARRWSVPSTTEQLADLQAKGRLASNPCAAARLEKRSRAHQGIFASGLWSTNRRKDFLRPPKVLSTLEIRAGGHSEEAVKAGRGQGRKRKAWNIVGDQERFDDHGGRGIKTAERWNYLPTPTSLSPGRETAFPLTVLRYRPHISCSMYRCSGWHKWVSELFKELSFPEGCPHYTKCTYIGNDRCHVLKTRGAHTPVGFRSTGRLEATLSWSGGAGCYQIPGSYDLHVCLSMSSFPIYCPKRSITTFSIVNYSVVPPKEGIPYKLY